MDLQLFSPHQQGSEVSAAIGQFGVHGVEARRDWPPFTLSEAQTVLAHYPLNFEAEEIVWHGQRPFSATGLIQLHNGTKVFLKRHDHRLRNQAAISEEHAFIQHLALQGMPVSRPFSTCTGTPSLTIGEWVYEAFAPLKGLDTYRDTPSWEPYQSTVDAGAAGEMLARLHLSAATFDSPRRKGRLLLSSMDALIAPSLLDGLEKWIPTQQGLRQALNKRMWKQDVSEALTPFHTLLVPLLPALQTFWGHGDWHGSNLFWTKNTQNAEIAGIFDFGMSDRTCPTFDLAVAIERSGIRWLDIGNTKKVFHDQISALVRGYTRNRQLSDTERALVCAFLPLVHVEFALSEVAYYEALVQDPFSAKVAYEEYLLGHARWFQADEGRRLLAWLSDVLGAS